MNAPYSLIQIVLLILLFYGFTCFLTSWKVISKKSHWYFWNLSLLITFLISGLLGMLAVVKVNYRLEIPHYQEILRIHIHVGIGMVMVAFLHFFRHVRYFFSPPVLKMKPVKTGPGKVDRNEKEVITVMMLLFLLGFTTFTAQLVLIREFISVFSGNELVIGFFLTLWLILTGAGSYVARGSDPVQFSTGRLKMLLVLMSFLPMLTLFMLYWLKSTLFPPGTETGPWEILTGIFLLLFPVCFLSGYLFVLLTGVLSKRQDKNLIARSYIIESLGSLAGGIIFSFLLVFLFRSLEVLALALTVTAASAGLFAIKKNPTKVPGWLAVFSLILLFAVFTLKLDTRIKSLFFVNQEIISNNSDFVGNSIVTMQEGQLNFYSNNNLSFYTNNVIDIEESAHYAMVQHEHPHQVLIVSGDAFPIAHEALKYNVDGIDILMFNKQYYRLTGKFKETDLKSDKIRTFSGDPVNYLQRKAEALYDIVLLNIPPPSTLKDNRFYTLEFFRILKKHCSPEAVVSLSLPSTANYAGEEAIGLNSVVHSSLKKVFRNVAFIPGEKNYYLASDAILSLDIAAGITEKGIDNQYVNPFYIDDSLLKERSRALLAVLDNTALPNRMLNPKAFLLHLREWLRMHGTIYWVFGVIPFLLFWIVLLRQTPVRAGLFVSGFSASSLQIVLILGYQLFFGNIFYHVALFFVVFLIGLTFGTHIGQKDVAGINRFNLRQLGLSILPVISILLFILMLDYSWFRNLAFLFHLVNATAAFFLGYLFSQAAVLESQGFTQKVSLNYSADLLGSAMGTYLSSVFLVPVLGIIPSLLAIGAASGFCYLYVFIRRGKYI